jgi:hypothetical protein
MITAISRREIFRSGLAATRMHRPWSLAKGSGFMLVSVPQFYKWHISGWHKGAKMGSMAELGLFDQKSAIAVTMPIATAFKFCIRRRKNGLLNR